MSLMILPLALPIAILLSTLAYVPGLLLAALFPRWILRHRTFSFSALPTTIMIWIWASADRGLFSFDEPVMKTYSILASCLAGGWCYHFTGHMTDQG